ncbi:MAG TPA: cytochrome c biogenesis protein CcsA, partial [bacterium]|nr:cytochrome c biogenesis protein CcsA [bacterium]
ESLDQLFEARGIVLDRSLIHAEVTYNRLRPFSWAWKFYLGSILIFVVLGFTNIRSVKTWGVRIEALLFLAGFAFHSYGFYLRCVIAGRPPVSNMYESIIWVSWAAVLFSLILSLLYRSGFLRPVAAAVSALALILAQSFPTLLDPSLAPLVPVLRSNLWLTVHVLTITLSYGAFALAWGIGHAAIFNFAFSRGNTERQKTLLEYLYRALQIGVVLLAAGTVLGGVWANYSWGRFWGWDPKETWALIALLGYLTVLHGRFAGWLDNFGFAVGSTVAFLGILMAWYGVNFVLAAGLHSYGFGGGGLPYVAAAVIFDLILIGGAAFIYKRRNAVTV